MNPLEHLIQRNDERRRKQSQRFYRFRLRTLVLAVGLYCAFCAATYYLGTDLLNQINRQANLTVNPIPSTPVSEVLPPICALVALMLGVVTAWGIFRLGPRYGFVGLCIALCLSLIALVLATSLHTAPFEETELREVQMTQILVAVSLSFAFIMPVCASFGWYASTVSGESQFANGDAMQDSRRQRPPSRTSVSPSGPAAKRDRHQTS